MQKRRKLGLTFTEMLSSKESNILMYRNCIADLQLHVDDIDEDYIRRDQSHPDLRNRSGRKSFQGSGHQSRNAGKEKPDQVIFDIDYRAYNWKNSEEISIYYSIVAKEADIIMGSREEFDLTEKLIKPGDE